MIRPFSSLPEGSGSALANTATATGLSTRCGSRLGTDSSVRIAAN